MSNLPQIASIIAIISYEEILAHVRRSHFTYTHTYTHTHTHAYKTHSFEQSPTNSLNYRNYIIRRNLGTRTKNSFHAHTHIHTHAYTHTQNTFFRAISHKQPQLLQLHHMKRFWHTYKRVISHTRMSSVTHIHPSVLPHTYMSQITYLNENCHTYE